MSDNYQAVYDAVRSRFRCAVDGDEIVNAIANTFASAGQTFHQAGIAAQVTEQAKLRPSVLYRPNLTKDGNRWCALYGDNIQDGCAGFGDTPSAAMLAFDTAWVGDAR